MDGNVIFRIETRSERIDAVNRVDKGLITIHEIVDNNGKKLQHRDVTERSHRVFRRELEGGRWVINEYDGGREPDQFGMCRPEGYEDLPEGIGKIDVSKISCASGDTRYVCPGGEYGGQIMECRVVDGSKRPKGPAKKYEELVATELGTWYFATCDYDSGKGGYLRKMVIDAPSQCQAPGDKENRLHKIYERKPELKDVFTWANRIVYDHGSGKSIRDNSRGKPIWRICGSESRECEESRSLMACLLWYKFSERFPVSASVMSLPPCITTVAEQEEMTRRFCHPTSGEKLGDMLSVCCLLV
jgi:hypothetical protein